MPQQDQIPKRTRTPIVETKISKSKDGKWIIFKVIITEIKPINYIKNILRDEVETIKIS